MTVTIENRFKLRRGTAANLATVNEVPFEAELVLEIDTLRLKVGDGVTAYNSLPYLIHDERFAVAGGTADALTATFDPAVALTDGTQIRVRAAYANTISTSSLAIDGGSALPITKNGNQVLATGDIYGDGHELLLRYVSSTPRWELLNPATVSGGGGGSGDFSLLSTVVVSSQPKIEFTGLTSGYYFRIVASNYSQSVSSDAKMLLQVDGTWITSTYFWVLFGSQSGNGNSVVDIVLALSVPSSRADTFTIDFSGCDSGEYGLADCTFTYALHKSLSVLGKTGRLTGIRIFPGSGNISGKFSLYAITR